MEMTGKNGSIVLDAAGKLTAVVNGRTGERCRVEDGGVSAVFDGKPVPPEALRAEWTDHGGYFEKTVTFTAPSDGVLESVTVLDAIFPDAREVHFHDDKTIWHVPLSVFARYENGGVYYGLEYPWWDDERRMAFSPWLPMKKGETFTSERAFLGFYARTGRMISSHGPYPGRRKQKYHDMFSPEKGGLPQHVPDFVIPDDMGIPEEELDAGEIRAMRDFFAEHLGHQSLPEEGYFIWQNGWWAKLFNADTAPVDVLEKTGVHDVLTARMYYGHATHPSTAPAYITDVRFDPLRFPADAGITDADKETEQEGFHGSVRESEAPEDLEYTDTFSAPPEYDALIRYGEAHGVHVTSFNTPNNAYRAYPEWYARKQDGTPYDYLGTPFSCPACRAYMERHFQMLSAVFEKYHPRLWSFDGRWLGYREFDYGEPVGDQPCWAEGHGHLPGKSHYLEWKYLMEFKRRLKERFPGTSLEHYYGVKRGGTWALKYVNSDENVFETSCADDTRFQTWHNENDRFRPTYLHFATIFGKEHDMEYSMISAISTSEYGQIANAYDNLRDDPKAVETFRK